MSLFNAIQGTFLNNLLETIKSNKNIQSSNNYEFLFEEIQNEVFGGDTIEFSNNQKRQISWLVDEIMGQLENNNEFNGFGFNPLNKDNKNVILSDTEMLKNLWQNNAGKTKTNRNNTRRASSNTRRANVNNTNENTTGQININNDGLQRIVNLKNATLAQDTDVNINQQGIAQPAIEQTNIDVLEGKTPEEKKTILEQTAQTQRDSISAIQNGTNEAVQNAQQNMQNAEANMNAAIDRDTNINEEVKTQIKESETAITAKSQEVSSKEAEIAQTDASIAQTQNTISNLQNSLNSLPSPSGTEEDKEKDAKLAERKSELQSQIAAKQAELAQLQAQKQQQESEKAQLEGEKGQLETQKDQIMAEELKDASPATKAAIKAYENSRTNVETTKTNELKKAQDDLNETVQKLSEVEAEIEQGKNNKANTNFDINGLIEGFEQGQTGDCWLLSSLQALSNTEEGQKILKDAIQINDDGTYTVKFNGADWAINITDADLRAARNSGQYSNGDDDVLLMEVAMQNYLTQVRNGDIQTSSADITATAQEGGINPLNSGRSTNLTELLTGNTNWSIGDNADINELFSQVQNNQNNTFATLSFRPGSNMLNTLNAGAVTTGASADSGHLWSVKSVSGNNITLINPWDSDQEIVTTKDELARQNIQFTYQELAA